MVSSIFSHLFPTPDALSYMVFDENTLPILLTYIMTNLVYPTNDMNLHVSLDSLRVYLSRAKLASVCITNIRSIIISNDAIPLYREIIQEFQLSRPQFKNIIKIIVSLWEAQKRRPLLAEDGI